MATNQRARGALPSGVTRLCDEIERWRWTRARRTAMPSKLWTQAVALARRTERPYAVAKALRLDYGSLKRRMAESTARSAPTAGPSSSAATFVELTGAELLAGPMGAGAVVEIWDEAARVRVTVRLSRTVELDVAQLISVLRSRGEP